MPPAHGDNRTNAAYVGGSGVRLWDEIARKPGAVSFMPELDDIRPFFKAADMSVKVVDIYAVGRYMLSQYEGMGMEHIYNDLTIVTPPYPMTFCESKTDDGTRWGILAVDQSAGVFGAIGQVLRHSGMTLLLFEEGQRGIGCVVSAFVTYERETGWFSDIEIDHAEQLQRHPNYKALAAAMYHRMANALMAFDLMNVSGATLVPHAANAKQQKRHKKRYGLMKSTWHTIQVGGVLAPYAEGDGEHTSPRQHTVRAHWRTIAPGAHPTIPAGRYFVRSHLRGKGDRGTVKSDYNVNPPGECDD